jgi:predicted HAD superfamily Cof-like phosphohydrolase
MKPQNMVREFHEAFGLGASDTPTHVPFPLETMRRDILLEEVQEYVDALAMHRGTEPRNRDVAIADALADIVYVAYGTALEHGFDLDKIIAEVHESNMSKLGEDGKPIYRKDGKVLKGPNYQPPRIKELLYG